VPQLLRHLIDTGSDVCAFAEVRYFRRNDPEITHKWVYRHMVYTLAEYLANKKVPGASGNYLYTKESWLRAGGYPESAGALDTWGFGLRQVATEAKMTVLKNTGYLHRHGYASYWVRDKKEGSTDLKAYSILEPFLHLLDDAEAAYVRSERGRGCWFANLERRPLRVKSHPRESVWQRMTRALQKRLLEPSWTYLAKKLRKAKRGIKGRGK
jgi:hypothetical protein